MKKKSLIENQSLLSSFENHLNVEFNKRILFSAPFGSGKSTFLRDYFESKTDVFITLRLNPVNYAVANNEDVFEYIKLDLLTELILSYSSVLQITEGDLSYFLTTQNYVLNRLKFAPNLSPLFKFFGPKGVAAASSVEQMDKVVDDLKDFNTKMNREEGEKIDEYYSWWEKQKGSIYERDEITFLIVSLIKRLKKHALGKLIVLTIDDLDRLDPEHVFRLLNIFSAHYNPQTDINKFEFDKVIMVCHYQNIKRMYAHKYGEGVDFAGYIDKFYSLAIFEFDVRLYLQEKLYDQIYSKYDENQFEGLPKHISYTYELSRYNNPFYNAIQYVLLCLIEHKLFTFRNFEHFKAYSVPDKYFTASNDIKYPYSQFSFLVLIDILRQFYPSIDELQKAFAYLSHNYDKHLAISSLESQSDGKKYEQELLLMTLYFIVDESIIFGNIGAERFEHRISIDNVNVQFQTSRGDKDHNIIKHPAVHPGSLNTDQNRPNVFYCLNEALTNVRKRTIIS
jgi:hypothetical protein